MRRRYLVGLYAAVAAMALACGQPQPAPTPTPPLSPAPTSVPPVAPAPSPTAPPAEPSQEAASPPTAMPMTAPEATLPDPSALLAAVNAAMRSLDTYHHEGELAVKANKEAEEDLITIGFRGDEGAGDDSQFIMDMSVKDIPGTFTFETRQVGGVSYAKDPLTEGWDVVDAAEDEEEDAFDLLVAGELSLQEIAVEEGTLAGEAVYRVTGSVPDDPKAELVIIFVDAEDMLVRELQIEGNTSAAEYQGLVPSELEEVFLSSIIRVSRFGEPVSIAAPEIATALIPPPPPLPFPVAPVFVAPEARWWQTKTELADGTVLVAGGLTGDGIVAAARVYDPVSDVWVQVGNMAQARALHTATLLEDGRVLVAGGATQTAAFASAETYHPLTGNWSSTGGLAEPRVRHTATLLDDGRVLVSGGHNEGGSLESQEVYDPATGTWSMAP